MKKIIGKKPVRCTLHVRTHIHTHKHTHVSIYIHMHCTHTETHIHTIALPIRGHTCITLRYGRWLCQTCTGARIARGSRGPGGRSESICAWDGAFGPYRQRTRRYACAGSIVVIEARERGQCARGRPCCCSLDGRRTGQKCVCNACACVNVEHTVSAATKISFFRQGLAGNKNTAENLRKYQLMVPFPLLAIAIHPIMRKSNWTCVCKLRRPTG